MQLPCKILIAAVALLGAAVSYSADSEPHMKTKVCGEDEVYCADVILKDGNQRLSTDATVTVEQIFGQDPQGTTYFYFGNTLEDANGIGTAGNTVRVQIPAAAAPLNLVYPAVDVTYTITAGDVASSNPERTVAQNVCSALAANSNFSNAKWKCDVAKDFALVHISSRLFNEFGTRTTWTLTCSGTTICKRGFDDISRRGKPTELSRSPNDPRQGILAIAGSVSTIPGSIGDRFFEYLKTSPGNRNNMLVNCSTYVSATCDFRVIPDPVKRIFVEYISCFGGGNGIKFGQMLSKSGGPLTNGIEIEIRSEGSVFNFPAMKSTENFKNLFATRSGQDFRIDIQSGSDQFIAQFRPAVAFSLEPQGTVAGGDDYIVARVKDNLSSGIQQLECAAFGFEREP